MKTGTEQKQHPLVGIAVAVHNSREKTRECLLALKESSYPYLFTCVVDDGSSDGTWEMLSYEFPRVRAIRGDGTLWWAGATNLAVNACLEAGCAYVFLLNPDCIVYRGTISILVRYALKLPETVVACVVVDQANPDVIWWAGTEWGPVKQMPLIWLPKYIYRRGRRVQELPTAPFETADTGGRGVLIPRLILERVGFLHSKVFPHYGADNDLALRIRENGFRIMVVPDAKVRVYVEQTGHAPARSITSLPKRYLQRLVGRKHGEFLRITWLLLKRHAPWYAIIPSYLASFLLISWRYWSTSLSMVWKARWSARAFEGGRGV